MRIEIVFNYNAEQNEWLEGVALLLCVCWKQSRIPGGISINIVICSNDVRLSGGSFNSGAVAISLNLILPHLCHSSPPPCFPMGEILDDTQIVYAKEMQELENVISESQRTRQV